MHEHAEMEKLSSRNVWIFEKWAQLCTRLHYFSICNLLFHQNEHKREHAKIEIWKIRMYASI